MTPWLDWLTLAYFVAVPTAAVVVSLLADERGAR